METGNAKEAAVVAATSRMTKPTGKGRFCHGQITARPIGTQ